MPEIRLEEVSKYYKQENRRIAVVEDINLVIRQGEFVFVTGSSGAGKSTLLQLIHGQLRPDHGSIYLNDTDTTHFRRWGPGALSPAVWLCSSDPPADAAENH